MANTRITELDFIPQLAANSVLVVDDVQALTTYKVDMSNIISFTGNAYAVAEALDSFATNTNASLSSLSVDLSLLADSGADIITVGLDTLSFLGDTAISTSLQSNTIQIVLTNTTVQANTYGHIDNDYIYFPVITVDAQGRVTDVTTANIYANVASVISGDVPFTGNVLFEQNIQISNVTITTNQLANVTAAPTAIYSYPKTYRAAEILVLTQDSEYEISKLLVIHDDVYVYTTQYGSVYTGSSELTNISASIIGSDIVLSAQGGKIGRAHV